MTLLARVVNGPVIVGEVMVGPFFAWPWCTIAALALLGLGMWRSPTDPSARRRLWWLVPSPLGWVLTAAVGGWFECDRSFAACSSWDIDAILLALSLTGLIYNLALVWLARGGRITAAVIVGANLAYTFLALVAGSEEVAGVGF